MDSFLLGLVGSLTGGIMLSIGLFVLYFYEKKQTNKLAQKLTTDLKSVYTERLMNTKSTVKTSGKLN